MTIPLFYIIVVLVLGALAAGGIYTSWQVAKSKNISHGQWVKNWYADFSTELAGAFVAAILFGFLLFLVQENIAVTEMKSRLIRELGSPDHGIAFNAVNELDARGWLQDGTLQRAYLPRANLQGIILRRVNLRGSLLNDAQLQNAGLVGADLQAVQMVGANLQNAILQQANFRDASISLVNFQGADLLGANLLDVYWFQPPYFDEQTRLPDGTYWTPDTDLNRFIDPDHPNFWRRE